MFSPSRYIAILVLAATLACPLTGVAADQAKGNLEVISDLTAGVAAELVDKLPAAVFDRGIYIKTDGEDEKYQLIRDIFTHVFTDNGITVFSTAGSSTQDTTGTAAAYVPSSRFRLNVRALEFSIQYPRIFRSHLIGGKRVKRSANVKLSSTLMNPDNGSVVWVKEAGGSYEDQFPFHLLGDVENDLLAFTKPQRDATKWSRMVEPVVVSGIIVGLIYLFFSNQSGD